MFKNIKKLDGRTVEFDSSAIIFAVAKAGKANGTELDQATCTMNLGNVYMETERFREAEKAYKDALRIYRATPDTELEQARCLANLSSCHRDRGQTSQARLCAQEALAFCKSLPTEATIQISSLCQWILERTGEA